MLRTRERFVLVAAVVFMAGSCGGGSGPGVTPPEDSGYAPDQGDDGAVGDAAAGEEVAPPLCRSDEECDDHNPCTSDRCQATGCEHSPVISGSCDDGDPCTEGDSCEDGVCKGGEFVCQCQKDADCPAASNQCFVKTCEKVTHQCVEGPRDNGTPCDDHDPCTEGEACWDGLCKGGASVCECQGDSDCPPPEDECSPLKCNLTNHTCEAVPKDDGTSCDDQDACTLQDQCSAGACKPGAPKDCDDQDGCTKDSCDPKTGECGHEYLGGWGCCASDAECDDGDPCTIEQCVTHQCRRDGEAEGPTGVGCASATGCSAGFCSEVDGKCRPLAASMPAVLFDWDLTTGATPKGMRWTTQAGGLTAEGAGPGAGEDLAVFAFPGHFVAAGVRVLLLTLADGLDCGAQTKVQVQADGGPAVGAWGCDIEGGRAVLGFQFRSEEASRLDLQVVVKAGARVARATLYLHAIPSCRPHGPVVGVSGTGVADLSAAGLRTVVGVGHRFLGETIRFGKYSLWNGVKDAKEPASGTMEVGSIHRTTLVPFPGDRFLFAYDGRPEEGESRIEVALLDAQGEVVNRAFVPGDNSSVKQYEPAMVATPDGRVFLVYSSSDADADGLGVRMVEVKTSGNLVQFGMAKTVNTDLTGDQTLPVLAWFGDGGIVVWKSWNDQVTPPSSIWLRKVSASGPEGPGFEVLKSSDFYQSMAVVQVGDSFLVAATTGEGALKGFVVKPDFSVATPWTGVPEGSEWSDVTLARGPVGALLVATRLAGGVARVVQVPVSQFGAVGQAVALSDPLINATATPVVGSWGPFLQVVAFNDTLSATKGTRIALLAPKCEAGPVSCAQGKASVCTGLGGSGYVEVPGAQGWCE